MQQPHCPNDNRQVRGQRTRERLLEQGLRLFAVKGPQGVGTRELARAAGTNIASIAFHFGGKEGLYRAVIDGVAEELARIHRAALAAADDGPAEADPGREAGERARRIMGALTLGLLASNRSQWMSLLLQRECIAPSEAFETIYVQAIAPTLDTLAALAATATGRRAEALDSRVLAFSLFTVASAFARNSHTFQRFSGLSDDTPEAMAAIGRAVADFTARGLTGRA